MVITIIQAVLFFNILTAVFLIGFYLGYMKLYNKILIINIESEDSK